MAGFLAALPLIFEGIDLVAGLFDEGRSVYETVAGKPSTAANPTALRAEVEALPETYRVQWAAAMQARVEAYKAETARLANEQGEIDPATLAAIPAEARARVALMRMTTRPWAVRLAMRALAWPPLFVVVADTVLMTINVLSGAFGWIVTKAVIDKGRIIGETVEPLQFALLAQNVLAEGSGFMTIYSWFAPTATTIVVTYMTLREVGKARGHADAPALSEIAGRAASLIRRIGK